ncbi:MAG: nitroreductase family deazaflavin-dependent oxidoreductase [Halieaceae bacterium]|nr:nitroreductase family deazaflavin-dependent oxidoreductase [Halieaceae bacterium]
MAPNIAGLELLWIPRQSYQQHNKRRAFGRCNGLESTPNGAIFVAIMSSANSFYRYILNPLVRALLRSPLHRMTSNNIGILHFTGSKTGHAFNTPLSFTRERDIVRLLSNKNTKWWRNLRGHETPVEMEIARKRYPGVASVLEGDSHNLRDSVRRFIRSLPRDANVYGLQLDAEGGIVETSMDAIAKELIVVEIQLSTCS